MLNNLYIINLYTTFILVTAPQTAAAATEDFT